MWIRREIFISALLGDGAIGGKHDDAVGAFDGGEAMGDGDGGVVAAEEGGEGGIDEGFGLGVKGGGGFVEDQDVRVFDEGPGNGDSLLLAARELGAAGANGGVETVGLEKLVPGDWFTTAEKDLRSR